MYLHAYFFRLTNLYIVYFVCKLRKILFTAYSILGAIENKTSKYLKNSLPAMNWLDQLTGFYVRATLALNGLSTCVSAHF